MRPFLSAGFVGVSVTLGALAWAFRPSFSAHVVVIPVVALLTTAAVGVRADAAVFAWWRGPACALTVLAVAAVAVPVCNGPLLLADPSAYGVRPLVAVLGAGFVPALVAGLVCSALARLLR